MRSVVSGIASIENPKDSILVMASMSIMVSDTKRMCGCLEFNTFRRSWSLRVTQPPIYGDLGLPRNYVTNLYAVEWENIIKNTIRNQIST